MQTQTTPTTLNQLETRCPVCGSADLHDLLELRQIPVLANVLWDRRDEALSAPRGDVLLAFCAACGHAFNRAFDPRQVTYNPRYENSLHFSARFQQYADALAQRLVERYDLHGKTIAEIGSGKGEFLRALCELGGSRGIGFDPSYAPEETVDGRITFVSDLYTEKYAHYQADFVLSRHVLEHIHRPAEFVENLRRAVAGHPNAVIYTEVPNFAYILRDTAVWDVIYEHYSYFTPHSLAALFTRAGFAMLDMRESFGEQFLSIEAALASDQPSADIPDLPSVKQAEAFRANTHQKMARWQEQLDGLQRSGRKAVLWGAGSKGISFLNLLDLGDAVSAVVDINPRKRGKYITGSGQQIVPPEALPGLRPDTIIVMNPIYLQEIQSTTETLGLRADFLLA